MKNVLKRLFLFASLLSLMMLAACSGTEKAETGTKEEAAAETSKSSNKNKTLFVGITNTPGTLNPINTKDYASIKLTSILFDTLFELDEPLAFQPKLAESMETEDNQNFVIKLNPKAQWTDGEPITAEDITFTLELMANPEVSSIGIQALSVIEGLDEAGHLPENQTSISGVEIVDPHTIKVHTKVPIDPDFLKQKLGTEVRFLPKHILKDVNPAELHLHPFMQKPSVTSGAFKLTNFAKDQYVELEKNKDYYRGEPKINKLIFKIMPSANLVAQLQSGEIQMNYTTIGPISIEDFEKVKNMSNVRIVSNKPYDYQTMFFNMQTMTDQKVRQAIAYAINRNLLVEKLLKGQGEVFEGPYTPIHPYYNKDVQNYSYDPEKAKELLKEANWDFNKTIDLAVPAGQKTREQAAAIISENLRAVGIKVQITQYDIPTIVQKGLKHEYDLLMLGIPFQLDPDLTQWYHSNGVYNISGYKNIDELIEKGKNESDSAKRKEIYDEVQVKMHEELPSLSLYAENIIGAISNKVKVGEPKVHGVFYNIQDWDIEE